MAKYRQLERLHPYNSNWTIYVKCLPTWTEFHPRCGKSIELILGDEEIRTTKYNPCPKLLFRGKESKNNFCFF